MWDWPGSGQADREPDAQALGSPIRPGRPWTPDQVFTDNEITVSDVFAPQGCGEGLREVAGMYQQKPPGLGSVLCNVTLIPRQIAMVAAVAQLSMTLFAACEARAASGSAWRLSSPQLRL